MMLMTFMIIFKQEKQVEVFILVVELREDMLISYVFTYQMMKSDQEIQQLKYGKESNNIKQ